MTLRYERELDYDEIAEITGLPMGTVKSSLHRARKELAEHMESLGWNPTTEHETTGARLSELLPLHRGARRRLLGFAERTMRAVKRAPLPAGRQRLRSPLAGLVGWAALIAGVAISSWAIAMTQPELASTFTRLFSRGVGIGVWLMQFASAGLALSDVFTTTVSR